MRQRSPAALVWLTVLSLGMLISAAGAIVFGLKLLTAPAAERPPAAALHATGRPSPPPAASDSTRRPGLPPAAPQLLTPAFRPEDARLTAEAAYSEMREALRRADARRAACFLPQEKLRTLREPDAILGALNRLTVDSTKVVRATTRGKKAVLFVLAQSEDITSPDGKVLPIDAVVRMAIEDGHWKVLSQLWLVASPPQQDQQEALAWLQGASPTPSDGGKALRPR
jgi:hypothetical protein